MNSFNPTTVMFIVYLLIIIGIGVVAYRATNNFSDYILGGRSLGSIVTALSAGASDMSGWLLLGLPGAIYLAGLSEVWIGIGLVIGAWLNWYLVAGRLRVHTEVQSNSLTLPDFFSNRFDDKKHILRISSAIVILVFFAVYCASGMVAGALLFESIFNMDYNTALWVSAFVTIGYVCFGGFLAVSWTDTFQALMMMFALLVAPIFAYLALGDGQAQFTQLIETARPQAFDIISNLSLVAILSSMAWGLGYFGQPHILVRFMAIDSVKLIPSARRTGIIWMLLCLVGSISVAFIAIAYFAQHPENAAVVNDNSEKVFTELVTILFNPWFAGIVMAGILSAIMSTLSSQLLLCSSALTEDLYKPFFRKSASEKELVWVGRLMVVAISLFAIYLASDPDSKVLGLVSYAWAGFGAAFGPLVILALFWKRLTLNGAVLGLIVGALTVVLWKNLLGHLGIYEIIPGFIFASATMIIVSLLGKAPSKEVVERFEKAERIYNETK